MTPLTSYRVSRQTPQQTPPSTSKASSQPQPKNGKPNFLSSLPQRIRHVPPLVPLSPRLINIDPRRRDIGFPASENRLGLYSRSSTPIPPKPEKLASGSKADMQREQHFELTPQSSLHTAQASLQSELEPAILALLSRSELHVAKLERRQQALVARSELLEGRLEGTEKGVGVRKQRSLDKLVRKASFGDGKGGKGNGGAEEKALRLKALRSKKERLGYAVERLGLQSQQRQRQLRMSVAAT